MKTRYYKIYYSRYVNMYLVNLPLYPKVSDHELNMSIKPDRRFARPAGWENVSLYLYEAW